MNKVCMLTLTDEDGEFLEVQLEFGEHEKPASDPDAFNINSVGQNETLLELLIERMQERYGEDNDDERKREVKHG